MARYIDADELQKAFEKIADEPDYMHEGDTWETGIYLAGSITDKQPTADVVEVKHGEWKLKSEIRRFMEEVDEYFYVECPFCERFYYVPFEFEDEKMLEYAKKNYPYCNCGAKMDGGGKDDL